MNHGLTRPAVMEGEAVHRVFRLAELAETPAYIVHLSSRDALNALREARDRGQAAYAETCPQYLYLSQDDMAKPGFEGAKYVCSPPLRTADHQEDLWMGLRGGDLSGGLDRSRAVQLHGSEGSGQGRLLEDPERAAVGGGPVHAAVRRRREGTHRPEPVRGAGRDGAGEDVGLYPRKGTIAPGSDADIVVFDPTKERTISASTHHMRVDYSAYEGRVVRGLPEVVMQRGQVLVENGEFHGTPGQGRFVPRSRITA